MLSKISVSTRTPFNFGPWYSGRTSGWWGKLKSQEHATSWEISYTFFAVLRFFFVTLWARLINYSTEVEGHTRHRLPFSSSFLSACSPKLLQITVNYQDMLFTIHGPVAVMQSAMLRSSRIDNALGNLMVNPMSYWSNEEIENVRKRPNNFWWNEWT